MKKAPWKGVGPTSRPATVTKTLSELSGPALMRDARPTLGACLVRNPQAGTLYLSGVPTPRATGSPGYSYMRPG